MTSKNAYRDVILALVIFALLAVGITFLINHIGVKDNNIAVITYKTITVIFLYFLVKREHYVKRYIQLYGTNKKAMGIIILYSFFVVITVLGIVLGLIVLLSSITANEIFKQYKLISVLMFSTVIVAPITEEFIFRGVIYNKLKEVMDLKYALVLQAFLFALIHVNPIQVGYTFVFGLLFGLIYQYSKSLIAAIVSHMVVNLVGTVGLSWLYYSLPKGMFIGVISICTIVAFILSIILKTRYSERVRD